jgi:hypothetical protein
MPEPDGWKLAECLETEVDCQGGRRSSLRETRNHATTKGTVGHYDARTRRQILDDLIQRYERFTLRDYLEATDHAIGRS